MIAAEQMEYIHVSNLSKSTVTTSILEHIKENTDVEDPYVEELKVRGAYKSFKVGIPKKKINQVTIASLWSENVILPPFRFNIKLNSFKQTQLEKQKKIKI